MVALATSDRLGRLAARQADWRRLAPAAKLELLERMRGTLRTDVGGAESVRATARRGASKECMGYDVATPEGRFEASFNYMLLGAVLVQNLDHLIASYRVLAGRDKPPKGLVVSKKKNGQEAVKVFPILPSETIGPNKDGVAELYVEPGKHAELLNLEYFYDDPDKQGAMVVLGAGNQGFLTVSDVLQALFVWNRVVLLKHHPLRGYQDEMIRRLFEPLIQAGYMDCEFDADFDRSALYLGPDLVAGVHMTGGKQTHDAIVWGPDKAARVARKEPPLLTCPMTSELGCVTPWIVAPYDYTPQELEAQALALFAAVYNNASCNCNAPKVVLASDQWRQLPEFVSILKGYLANKNVPAAYYPGCVERWETFRNKYGKAECLGKGVGRPGVSSPTLPWLVIELNLDLSTDQGWKNAQNEYILRNEPFAPVLTIATLHCADKGTFMEAATKLCNDYMFGSLSASLSVPQNKMDDPQVEDCISELRYGSVVVNGWTAMCYTMLGCSWGAYPGEALENVESGIGHIHNLWFVPHAQKCVVRMPCVSKANDLLKNDDYVKGDIIFSRLGDFLLSPGVRTFALFLSTQVELGKLISIFGGVGTVALLALLVRKLGIA